MPARGPLSWLAVGVPHVYPELPPTLHQNAWVCAPKKPARGCAVLEVAAGVSVPQPPPLLLPWTLSPLTQILDKGPPLP